MLIYGKYEQFKIMLTIPLATTVFTHVGMYSIFLELYDIYISLTSWVKPRDGKPLIAKKKYIPGGSIWWSFIVFCVLVSSFKCCFCIHFYTQRWNGVLLSSLLKTWLLGLNHKCPRCTFFCSYGLIWDFLEFPSKMFTVYGLSK